MNYFEEKTVRKLIAQLRLQVEAKTESMDRDAADLRDQLKTSDQKFQELQTEYKKLNKKYDSLKNEIQLKNRLVVMQKRETKTFKI